MIFRRHVRNPIVTRSALPEVPPRIVDPSSVFNPGATLVGDQTVLLLRVQARSRETFLWVARSDDGVVFRPDPEPAELEGLDRLSERVYHVYDPRITRIDDRYVILLALDLDVGCRLGVATTANFDTIEFLGLAGEDDARNGVLFPERREGRYLRLERPNQVEREGAPATGDTIRLAHSEDLVRWTAGKTVMRGRPRYWDEWIGPGTPPLKTRHGWLVIYHGVATHFAGVNLYQAGAVLLELDDPSRVLARTRGNVLEPRENYEQVGQVPNVVFPTGLVPEQIDEQGMVPDASPVRLYYGAADTVVCLATSTVAEIVAACDGA